MSCSFSPGGDQNFQVIIKFWITGRNQGNESDDSVEGGARIGGRTTAAVRRCYHPHWWQKNCISERTWNDANRSMQKWLPRSSLRVLLQAVEWKTQELIIAWPKNFSWNERMYVPVIGEILPPLWITEAKTLENWLPTHLYSKQRSQAQFRLSL